MYIQNFIKDQHIKTILNTFTSFSVFNVSSTFIHSSQARCWYTNSKFLEVKIYFSNGHQRISQVQLTVVRIFMHGEVLKIFQKVHVGIRPFKIMQT